MERGPSGGEKLPLDEVLRDALGPRPTRRAAKGLVARCHRMARAYLRKRKGDLREDVLGAGVDDLALDAVAELFERDEQGRFPELRRWFRSYFDLEARGGRSEGKGEELAEALIEAAGDASQEDLHSALRKLVWSAVGDWLYEAYRAADRSLSNQIRALKRAAKASEAVRLTRRRGESWIEIAETKAETTEAEAEIAEAEAREEAGRQMPIETMEAYLAGAVAGARSAADLLGRAAEALRAHRTYEAAYPVVRLAQAARAARARVQGSATTSKTKPKELPIRPKRVRALVVETTEALREEKRPTYVGKGKISEATYRAYVRALKARLAAKYVPLRGFENGDAGGEVVRDVADRATRGSEQGRQNGKRGERPSRSGRPSLRPDAHYEALSSQLEGLSKKAYREEHRARFEYLFQEAEEALTERLQEVVGGAAGEKN